MADNTVRAANMARILALVHIIVGFLLFCFGIADLVVGYFWTGYVSFGIWTGVWMCIAGGLGIPGSRKDRSTSRNVFAGIFMGFSITSAVFGGIIIICYSFAIAFSRDDYYYNSSYENRNYDAEMAFSAIILILGIVEFATGIWAAVCLCLMKPCTCRDSPPPQQGQVMNAANTGYVMAQGPGGVPVAISMQAGGSQLAQAMPPGGITTGLQHQQVRAAPAGAMSTGYYPQQAPMPPPYAQG